MLFFSDDQQQKKYERYIAPYVSHIFSLACRLCKNREDAEDITQDLLIKLFKYRDKLYTLDNPKPYLSRTVYNQYVDHMRRQSKHLNAVDLDIDNEIATPQTASSSPENATEFDITLDNLNRALDKLTADHRTIIVLHDMEGFTFEEISEILKIATGTTKSRHHRARNALKTALKQ